MADRLLTASDVSSRLRRLRARGTRRRRCAPRPATERVVETLEAPGLGLPRGLGSRWRDGVGHVPRHQAARWHLGAYDSIASRLIRSSRSSPGSLCTRPIRPTPGSWPRRSGIPLEQHDQWFNTHVKANLPEGFTPTIYELHGFERPQQFDLAARTRERAHQDLRDPLDADDIIGRAVDTATRLAVRSMTASISEAIISA